MAKLKDKIGNTDVYIKNQKKGNEKFKVCAT